MKVSEYRDLMSHLADMWASCRSAATDDELNAECERLEKVYKELQAADCQRATRKDKMKAIALLTRVRQHLFSTRMYLHDNQRIEAEYLGKPW